MPAVGTDEMRAADRVHALELAATFVEEDDVFGAAEPERLNKPAAFGKLVGQRLGHAQVRGRDEEPIEGRLLR